MTKRRLIFMCLLFEAVFCSAASAVIIAQAKGDNHVTSQNTWVPIGLLVAGIGATGLFVWHARGLLDKFDNRIERNKRVIDQHITAYEGDKVEMLAHRSAMEQLAVRVETLINKLPEKS